MVVKFRNMTVVSELKFYNTSSNALTPLIFTSSILAGKIII